MTIAQDIINQRQPDYDYYLSKGDSLEDIDEYGFTPLIESVITRQPQIAQALLARKVDVNKMDVAGRTALHWATDLNDIEMSKLLLQHGADVNAYTRNGLSILVYPLLRQQDNLKQLLYKKGAKVDFALDFINAKLIGHRFELFGEVDIVNADGEFVELDYEGFILEFTVAVVKDSLRRFIASFASRHLRHQFPGLALVMEAFSRAATLLQYQQLPELDERHLDSIAHILQSPMQILPAASRGHAICFIRYKNWWAKIDRGENSKKEGSVNIYRITNMRVWSVPFLQDFLYKKQSRAYFHQKINQVLGLELVAKFPMSSQIVGNCSWANVQAVIPVAYAMQYMDTHGHVEVDESIELYEQWQEWDKDRALDECIGRFYLATPARKASIVAVLGAVLYQACDYDNKAHLARAERILQILTLPEYYYVLQSYLEEYCVKHLTARGNNLLKILDDCGVNPNIGVNPVATGLRKREDKKR